MKRSVDYQQVEVVTYEIDGKELREAVKRFVSSTLWDQENKKEGICAPDFEIEYLYNADRNIRGARVINRYPDKRKKS